MKILERRVAFVGVVLTGLAALGCNQRADSGGVSEMDELARMLDQPKPVAPQPQAVEPTPPPVATEPPSVARPARRANENANDLPDGYLGAIAKANRSIRTRTENLAWIQAVTHFKATEGRMPRSHDEFMSGVIKAFDIPLPELEPGEEYLYVPGEGRYGELYIVQKQP